LAAVFGLLLWQAGELKLAGYVFGGFAAAFGIFAAIGYGALQAIGRLGRTGSVSWRYGLANLLRRPRANAVQITAIAVGLTAILLLTMIRGDLLDAWRGRLPPDAPDRFLVNIQPEQRGSAERVPGRERPVKRPHPPLSVDGDQARAHQERSAAVSRRSRPGTRSALPAAPAGY